MAIAEMEDWLILEIERAIEYVYGSQANMCKDGYSVPALYMTSLVNQLIEIKRKAELIAMKRNGKIVNLKERIEELEEEEKRGKK